MLHSLLILFKLTLVKICLETVFQNLILISGAANVMNVNFYIN